MHSSGPFGGPFSDWGFFKAQRTPPSHYSLDNSNTGKYAIPRKLLISTSSQQKLCEATPSIFLLVGNWGEYSVSIPTWRGDSSSLYQLRGTLILEISLKDRVIP